MSFSVKESGSPGPFVKQTDYYNAAREAHPSMTPKGLSSFWKRRAGDGTKKGWLEKNGKPLRFTLITNSGMSSGRPS